MKAAATIAILVSVLFTSGCTLFPKGVEPRPIQIEAVKITTAEFQGRFEAHADVTGYLSSAGAQLIEPPRQWREGYRLYIEMNEQPPGDETGGSLVPVRRRIPIETIGLPPGVYIININGKEEHLEIDGSGLRPASDRRQML